jgi:hypothetical protein
VAACNGADRDGGAVCDQHPQPDGSAGPAGLAGPGSPASPADAASGDPATAKYPVSAAIQLRECPLSLRVVAVVFAELALAI